MKILIHSFLTLAAFIFASMLCEAAATDATYVNFEGKQTAPVRLSPDGTRLFAVNTPDARLSDPAPAATFGFPAGWGWRGARPHSREGATADWQS